MLSTIREAISKRDLIRELVIKDLKLRYSRPALGVLWAFLTPLFTVIVFYIVFSLIFKVETAEAPFFLYLMSAIFPWSFFQGSIMSSTSSLMENKNLIREARFPHYCIPVSITLANAVNFIPSLLMVSIISAIVKNGLPIFFLFLPLVLFLQLGMIMGIAIIASVIYVRIRDLKYLLEIMLLLLFYLTPSFYSLSMVEKAFPPFFAKLYIYNPLVGMVNLYRVTLFKGFYQAVAKETGIISLICIPLVFTSFVLALSFYIYLRNKRALNDHLSY
jgi:ABC-type polysaccharide/polyol phosphate export permease